MLYYLWNVHDTNTWKAKSLIITPIDSNSATLCVVKSSTNGVCSEYQQAEERRGLDSLETWSLVTEATHTNLQMHQVRVGYALWHMAITRLSAETQAHRPQHHWLSDGPGSTSCPLTETECTDRDRLSPPWSVILGPSQTEWQGLFGAELRVVRAKVWFNHWPNWHGEIHP